MKWKHDWSRARKNLTGWWNGEALAVAVVARRDRPVEPIPQPAEIADVRLRRTDPAYRCRRAEHEMANQAYLGEAFPYFDTQMGPGSLGTFLGATPRFAETTVWYEPCIHDPDAFGPIRFDADGEWFRAHMALIEEGLRRADGRYLVGIPDLIENLDTLAALRGSEQALTDLVDRPQWVRARLAEINQAYFQAFDIMFQAVRDADGGNAFAAFGIWGPGRTAKLQCDASCMLSPGMFREFVVPHLSAQCDWLDYSVYHLDGPGAVQHLDALLAIDGLSAIQWTPGAGQPNTGDPKWYDLYRRIRTAGKSVEAMGVWPKQIGPLLDAVGPKGLLIRTQVPTEAAAEKLLRDVEGYRR